ncbi:MULTISPECIES: mechanosensitive ion channel family protein [unclassified Bacillus (in: firmicutes)]|uniref:mechanosensitive ion channel family protein n=1 Tax=unclassified Bacillus (in: firmicutes) TaxID=185979 RepID=UPI0008EAE847|nr:MULTISPECIES: mechanosensitive ion channel family protein [unclassified Bacillus (in: firmicutes)]SFA81510.1 MscS family membrane protein [Bacillus sp. UNCCL13]SFQ71582.1 MscS family membrane protein [Bacillus sp. cl95]
MFKDTYVMAFLTFGLEYETLKNLGISIGILAVFILFRNIFTKYVFQLILKIFKKAPTDFFTKICLSFERPLGWAFIILGLYVAMDYFPFIEQHNSLFLKFLRSMVIILITWGLFNLSSPTTGILVSVNQKMNNKIDLILLPFISRTIRVILIAISISIIGQEFDYDVNGLVAGLGLGGLAFALAAKEAVGNLIGGIVIVTEKPFTVGDWILTPSVEGTVEDINFRSTKIRTFSQALVTVPNSTLANEPITNWSRMGKRRINFHLGVNYQTTKDQITRVVHRIEQMLKTHDEVHQDTIMVAFDHYNDSSLDILLYFFTNTTVWADHVKIKHEINLEIMGILEEEGVEVAFPSRTIYVKPQSSELFQTMGSLD